MKDVISQTAERARAVEKLYFSVWGIVREAALTNPHITETDAHQIVTAVVNQLPTYAGPIDEAAFLDWTSEIIKPAIAFAAIRRQCEPYVRGAIRKVLALCADLGVNHGTEDEIASETWVWALRRLDDLLIPGTAKISTRLFARARLDALAWRQRQIRAKNRFAVVTNISDLARDADGKYFFGKRDGIGTVAPSESTTEDSEGHDELDSTEAPPNHRKTPLRKKSQQPPKRRSCGSQ